MSITLEQITTIPAGRSRIAKLSNLSEPDKSAFDKVRFGQIVRDMKGRYSTREYAARTGLSESFLSKAITGGIDNPPSKRTMLKLGSAVSDIQVPLDELLEAAGYTAIEEASQEQGEIPEVVTGAAEGKLSRSASIREYYGGDLRSAKYAFETIMTDKVIEGPVTTWMDRNAGYFTITDATTGQEYVVIPAYCGFNEGAAGVLFAAAELYNKLAVKEEAADQIFYILCDNEDIYRMLIGVKKNEMPKATVVLLTDDHRTFKQETALVGSKVLPEPISEA